MDANRPHDANGPASWAAAHCPEIGSLGMDLMMEQSPAARSSNKAPSDSDAGMESWHDDASSSLATFTDRDGAITVNTQRLRMGEHLKGKLQGMIRQHFESYLRITQTLQNDTGKLAALECELRAPTRSGKLAPALRTSISCNEDGTFLVYSVPDVLTIQNTSVGPPDSSGYPPDSSGYPTTWASSASLPPDDGAEATAPHPRGTELLQRWGSEVGEFGMSGRCHSLTALFHFGYTAWKQMLGDMRAQGIWCVGGDYSLGEGHIAEEEGGFNHEPQEEEALEELSEPAVLPVLEEEPHDLREMARLLSAAMRAADRDRHQQATELCSEGIELAKASSYQPWRSSRGAASSSSAAGSVDSESTVWQLLLLRSSMQVQLHDFELALRDSEELTSLQPTCAEGYWWQSVALQGLHRQQEALEALMSALEYEPQNPTYQQAFTSMFEEISSAPDGGVGDSRGGSNSPEFCVDQMEQAPRPPVNRLGRNRSAASSSGLGGGRLRAGLARDALSTTTQATHLSSRSTTPTEVSAPLSRSSSNDSVFVAGAAFDVDAS